MAPEQLKPETWTPQRVSSKDWRPQRVAAPTWREWLLGGCAGAGGGIASMFSFGAWYMMPLMIVGVFAGAAVGKALVAALSRGALTPPTPPAPSRATQTGPSTPPPRG